jgi:hypothetical protein
MSLERPEHPLRDTLADYVNRAVAEAVAENLDPEETRQRIDVGEWRRSLVGDDPVLGRYFRPLPSSAASRR